MSTKTYQRDRITITIELPKSPTFPLASPVSEPMNTAAAVSSLYES